MRPNILFLISDEHRADVAGFAGNGVIRTPVLDRLAREGVVFENAYCPSPICVPGRQAMMAGIYPRALSCENFDCCLPAGAMTLPRQFSHYAYNVVGAGKTHDDGQDQLMGFTQRVGNDMKLRPMFMPGLIKEEQAKYRRPVADVKWSQVKEVQRACAGVSPRDKADEYALQGALMAVEEHFIDPYYDREQPQQPLFLYYGTIAPHYPYIAREPEFCYYLPRVPVYENQTLSDHFFLSRMRVQIGPDVTKREMTRAVAAYYGMIDAMDQRFGRLMDGLTLAGQNLDDWIIVYTSDHGEMLGEHGVFEKQKFYEGSARVPLIIRYPKGFAPARVTQNVNTLDLFATLCELAGLPVPAGLDSRSLVPLMRGDASLWEDETASQFGGQNLMIKRGALKYHFYEADKSELLFDLTGDPGELCDVARDPAYATALEGFRARRARYGFDRP